MPQNVEKTDVIPFFKIQGSELMLKPEDATATKKVWLQKDKLTLAILDSLAEGVFTIDFNMKVTVFNKAAERITGFTAEEAIGRSCVDVFCNLGGLKAECLENCPMRKTMQHRLPIVKKRTICNKKGEILTVTSTTNLLFDLDNNPIGGVETLVDITALEALKEKWIGKKYNLGSIVGKSNGMVEIYQLIESISGSMSNVLIQGETGTGKGLIASAIHYHSPNHKGPFVHVNCTAMPENLLESELFGHVKGAFTGAIKDRQGRFEQAHKGTLFLDEIGDISPAMQAKLLRAVEDKQFERLGGNKTIHAEVRIIAATNRNLDQAVAANRFRSDLFFRLNIIPVKLPPLRARLEDIPLLVEHFIEKFNFKMGKDIQDLDPEILETFVRYTWPGNVRELESTLEYAFVQCRSSYLEMHTLPPRLKVINAQTTDLSLSNPVASEALQFPDAPIFSGKQTEEDEIRRALTACKWKKAKTAERLNISRSTLWRLMKKYRLD
jgi:PAS domain S-box-containing protein